MVEQLNSIADQMEALLPEFVDGGNISGLILPTEYASTFKALAIEAKSILDNELGRLNEFSSGLIDAVNFGGFAGGPSFAGVQESSQIVRASVRAVTRKRAGPPVAAGAKPYVDPARIIELQAIGGG